jgi:hypothetical protein
LAYIVEDSLPHCKEGEVVLLEHVTEDKTRVLDLGTGDRRPIKLLKVDTLTRTEFMHVREWYIIGKWIYLLGKPPTEVISLLPLALKLRRCDDASKADLLSVGQLKNLGGIFR